jgi:hypothetical protein
MTEKMTSMSITNVMNTCIGLQYKYAPILNVTDWTGYVLLSQSELQGLIDAGSDSYSVLCVISDFTIGVDAGIEIKYLAIVAATDPVNYYFSNISQDIVIWFSNKVSFTVLQSGDGSNLVYSVLTSLTDIRDNIPLSAYNTLTDLNNQLATVTGNCAVVVYGLYDKSSSNNFIETTITYL